jgi:hypothetical protein
MRFEISPGKMLETHILSSRLGVVVHTSNTTIYKAYVGGRPWIYLKNN